MIAGTIIGGTAAETLVFRGLGPSLATDRLGISDPLPNPMLQLVNSQGTTLFTNDDWQDTQAAEITAAGLARTNPLAAGIRQPCSRQLHRALVRCPRSDRHRFAGNS
jgi:hypothetical protein